MTKITLGQQHDDSSSEVDVDTTGGSALEIAGGDLHDRAKQRVRVNDRVSSAAIEVAPQRANLSKELVQNRWSSPVALGSFLLMALVLAVALFAAMTKLVSALWIPLVLVASIVVLYLVACAVLPRETIGNLTG